MYKIGNYITTSQKGIADGIATLDNTGNVPASQLNNVSGGGDSIYTADGTLTGNRAVDLDTKTLTIDGTSSTSIPFTVNSKEVYSGIGTFFRVNLNGGISVRGSAGSDGNISAYSGHPSSQPRIFHVGRFGGGEWYGGAVTIGTSSTSSKLQKTDTNVDFYDVNNNLRHKIGLSTGSNNQHTRFFYSGYTNNGRFIIGSSATISTENISLQGSTLIKGNGTSTGSALAIYDNDTTPVKLWDFLDNGNIGVSQSSSFLLSANKTLKVDGSSNTNQNIFELNGATNAFGTGAVTVGAYGNVEVKGTNSAGNFKVLTMLGNEYFTLDGNGNNSTLRTKAFDIGTSSTTGYKMSFDAGRHQFIRGGIVGAYFNLVNSSVQFWEAGMTSRKFIVGGSALVGTEQISLQGSTLINGLLDMNNNRISNTIVNPTVQETPSTATFTINADEETTGVLTAMASATTIASPTGTPVQGQNLIFRFKDNGTARALTWNAIFRAIGITLPTTTTANKLLYVGCKYNSTDTKWDVVSLQEEA